MKDKIIKKQEELIKLLDDCNFSTMVSKKEWEKRKRLFDELAALKEQKSADEIIKNMNNIPDELLNTPFFGNSGAASVKMEKNDKYLKDK